MHPVDISSVWSSFPHDPRNPANATLRASDRDRDVLHQVLAEAYAEGRLDREEYDERGTAVSSARTLGELPGLVADLVPALPARRPDATTELVLATSAELRQRGEAAWRKDVMEAGAAFVVPTVICLIVWAAVMFGDYFWPGWVMLGTGINVLQTVLRRQAIVDEHVRKLEKKQARELRKRELEP